MKEYSRPVVEKLDEKAEGVYAASGDDNNETVCRYGRKQANRRKTEQRFIFQRRL